MGFFTKDKEHFLGVDFGTRSIKAVELTVEKNKPLLTNYAWVSVADNDMTAGADPYHGDHAARLKNALAQLFATMRPRTEYAHVSIPSFNGLVMMIDFPRMDESEVEQAIQFEARKYIPGSLDDVNISWEIAQTTPPADGVAPPEDGDLMKVLLVAAPKSEVQHYDNLFSGMPLSIDSLELETFSMVRSLVGSDPGRFLVVDIGAKNTNIIVVSDGIVHVNRSTDIGGRDLTNTISESMNISTQRAQSYKEGGRDFFGGPEAVLFPPLDFIVSELQRVITAQQNQKFDSIILSGGTAELKGLGEFFSQRLGIPTRLGNPWGRVIIDEKIKAKLTVLGPSLSVAVGLALRGVEEKIKQ